MTDNRLAQILLAPFSFLYGLGISLRNMVYDAGLLKSSRFNIPIISVGNLSIGGTGKTPHIEYLIRLLVQYLDIATLSRGYMRKSKGFRFINVNDTVVKSGDEPLVFKRKYPNIVVAVSESRATGIPQILQYHSNIQTILLDDAFQHRSVLPGLNILLTPYEKPFTRDYLIPSGRLREWRSAYKRADMIIVTKCPSSLTKENAQKLVDELKLQDHQSIYFSYYKYHNPYFLFDGKYRIALDHRFHIILLSAIASTDYLFNYLEQLSGDLETIYYEDHHIFTNHDMSQLKLAFENISADKKIIITTEKDAVRLAEHRDFIIKNKLPIYVLPIEVQFHFEGGSKFDKQIKDYLLNFQV